MSINSYDFDGVIYIPGYKGLMPTPDDIIVTGRVKSESSFVLDKLDVLGVRVQKVYFNNIDLEKRTRYKSGVHKAKVLSTVSDEIGLHFEDDPLQAKVIKELCPWLDVVLLTHNLVEL